MNDWRTATGDPIPLGSSSRTKKAGFRRLVRYLHTTMDQEKSNLAQWKWLLRRGRRIG